MIKEELIKQFVREISNDFTTNTYKIILKELSDALQEQELYLCIRCGKIYKTPAGKLWCGASGGQGSSFCNSIHIENKE